MHPQILVPLDGSALAEGILPHAALLARATDSALTLLRVIPQSVIDTLAGPTFAQAAPDAEWPIEPEASNEYLTMVVNRLAPHGVHVTARLAEGDPAQVIIQQAAQAPGAAMIAMATHGLSGPRRWVFGSVAEQVLHGATTPLLLVRPREGAELARLPMPAYRRILVPLDGFDLAEQALAHAQTLAARLDATLILVAVAPRPGTRGVQTGGVGGGWGAAQQTEATRLGGYLRYTRERLAEAGLRAEGDVVFGHTADEILRVAEQTQADLIVMGTHSRSGLQRLMLGSVALKVTQGATRPILLIRAVRAARLPGVEAPEPAGARA